MRKTKNILIAFLKSIPASIALLIASCFTGAPLVIYMIIKHFCEKNNYSQEAVIFILVSVSAIALIFVACLYAISDIMTKSEAENNEFKSNLEQKERELIAYESELENDRIKLVDEQRQIDYYRQQTLAEIENIINESSQSYPWLSKLLSDYQYERDQNTARILKRKKRPALKASEEVTKIAKEKRILLKKCKAYEYQLNFYETLFPWLEEFKELPPVEAYEVAGETNTSDEYSRVRDWLSPEDYNSLPSHVKWQRALDNYIDRPNKTNWHIGIEYERYVGYVYESAGYVVEYEGAIKGLDDRGRDIIAKNSKEFLVIQCKRWSKEKTIHEKHIMQLFGSVTVLNMEKNTNAKGVFITTTKLSDVATYFAQQLNIKVFEFYEYKPHPMVKCNLSKTGEKIYHLPFDQQYDKVRIDNKNSFYVETVKEAEDKGFRHAYRWKGDKQ